MSKNPLILAAALLLGGTFVRGDGPAHCAPPACAKPTSCFSILKEKCGKKDCIKKECVRVDDVKKKTHIEYRTQCTDICLPGCHFCKLNKKCDNCTKDRCGKPRTVRKLVKRIVTEEKSGSKCIVIVKDPCTIEPALVPGKGVTPEGKKVEALPDQPMPVPTEK